MRISIAAVAAALFLTACAQAPVALDQPPVLQADEGIAAVVLDAPGRIMGVEFTARFPGGKGFEVPDTQGGAALYLVPAKAGRYCLQHFRYERHPVSSREDVACFTVVAGHITYSGHIDPELDSFSARDNTAIYTSRHYRPAEFRKLLEAHYPRIAAAYPLAAPQPAPAGADVGSLADELSSWTENGQNGTQTIYVQNNTAWQMKLTRLRLYLCQNLKPACSDTGVNVPLAPFATQKLITVGPADPASPYSYSYEYWHEADE